MMIRRSALVAFFVLAALTEYGHAQMAPTGSHYGGRPSDTGYSVVNEQGGFSASVALELPPSRGGLPVPLQIVSGGRGFGAAGLGWDVPLSYVLVDRSLVRRRPAYKPGSSPMPREQITVVLPGRTSEMVAHGAGSWIGRYAPDLSMTKDSAGNWQVIDGAGVTYTFVQKALLSGTGGPFPGGGMALLDTIAGPGGARVALTYNIRVATVPGSSAPVIALDLLRVNYNPHPSAGCFKNEVSLDYDPLLVGTPPPLGFTVVGNITLGRQHKFSSVSVKSRATCFDPFTKIRSYSLAYEADPDTQLPRLATVTLHGRSGTPEATASIPIARYTYGAATIAVGPVGSGRRALHYEASQAISKPPGAGRFLADTTQVANSYFDGPGSGENYASLQSLTDFTGDGRPDLVFGGAGGRLQIARNVPDATGDVALDAPVPFADATFASRVLDARSATAPRFSSTSLDTPTRDYVWRQAIDVNGDGRVDVIDASKSRNIWTIYVNTPGPGPSGIKWEKRGFNISRLRTALAKRGLTGPSGYLPLSRRTTGRDYSKTFCWKLNDSLQRYVPMSGQCDPVEGQPVQPPGLEKTFVEWELADVNGDGYPDVVFNSSSVDYTVVTPSAGSGSPPYLSALQTVKLGIGDRRDVMVAFNFAGLRMESPSYEVDPFSLSEVLLAGDVAFELDHADPCGVGMWTGDMEGNKEIQTQHCAFVDVNGDGLADRVQQRKVLLGTGFRFGTHSSVALTLPTFLSRQDSGFPDHCPMQGTFPTRQLGGLRDLTGDGIPDLVTQSPTAGEVQVYVGTGTGFPNAPVSVEGRFLVSRESETCDGKLSFTTAGLFDMDGDGTPDVVSLETTSTGSVLSVWRLVGGGERGAPSAGRIDSVDNGAGAVTRIHYRSAKDDGTTTHQVPFPEIVVDRVETTGTAAGGAGLGGSLSARRYAYGNNSVFYDPILDGFRPTGYLRSVELAVTATPGAPGETNGSAIVTDRYPLSPANFPDGFERYLRVGHVSDVSVLAVAGASDPWSLLIVDTSNDQRRVSGTHEDVKARTFVEPSSTTVDCFDLLFPYDSSLSMAWNFGLWWWPCSAHGFMYTQAVTSWRGTAAPPATDNVQSGSSVGSVDANGRPLLVRYDNDLNRADDDVCMDLTYAVPITSGTRAPWAPAIRTVYGCTERDNGVVYSADLFEYDHLPVGIIGTGLPTAHTVRRYASDTGAVLGTIREFDAWYDASANPVAVARVREDGAQRTTTVMYDAFGLVPRRLDVTATGIPTLSTTTTVDPVTMQVLDSTDANGTVRGTAFDGFGRPVFSTIAEPATSQRPAIEGVLAAWSYSGFETPQLQSRTVSLTSFRDPVPIANVAAAKGYSSTTYLDELGRSMFTLGSLGDDYAPDRGLVVGKKTYDGLGRVSFAADPYSKSQDPATAYGTTQVFAQDGTVAATIRGSGPQAFTTVADASVERYPTLFTHAFFNHQEVTSVQLADAVTPSSAQNGVRREVTSSAIGWDLQRSTWRGSNRLEYAELAHDRLGRLAGMTRYQDPSAGLIPVTWTWKLDSLGRVLGLTEPASASQSRAYSDWGELLETTWSPPSPEPAHKVVNRYDALGRLTHSEERNAGVPDPDAVFDYAYDTARTSPIAENTFVLGRLASATTARGDEVRFGYDALGNITTRTYVDTDGTAYGEQSAFHADGAQAWIQLGLPDNAYAAERVDYDYDTAGRLRRMWYSEPSEFKELFSADSVDAWGRIRKATLGGATYDAAYADGGRRLPKAASVTGTFESRAFSFDAFDAMGRLVSRGYDLPSFSGREDVAYDALGRLRKATRQQGATVASHWGYQYDPLGNVLGLTDFVGNADATLSYLATDRDRICRVGYGNGGLGGTACNVEYDSFGNVTIEPTRTGHNELRYFNSGAVRTASNSSGTTASFRYDPFGRFQDVTIHSGTTELRDERHFGSLITKRRQKSPAGGSVSYIDRRFPGADFTVSRRGKPGAPWTYELGDSRGVLFTTSANGSFTQDTDYAPFGEVTFKAGAEPGVLGYSSHQWNGGDALDDLGLVYVGARIYDPVIGRFLSRDPLLFPRTAATSNPYAFAFNDPANLSDPTGLDPCSYSGGCGVWASYGGNDPIVSGTGGALLAIGGWAVGYLWSRGSGSAQAGASHWREPDNIWQPPPPPLQDYRSGTPVGRFLANEVGTRVVHGIRFASGATGFAAGWALCHTGVACGFGIGFMAGGADVMGSAAYGFFTGGDAPTVIGYALGPEWQAIEEAGVAAGSIAAPIAIASSPPMLTSGFKEAANRTAGPPGGPPNRIYSARELWRRADEPGPFHNFPESFDEQIFNQGSRTVNPNYWRTPKPGLSNDSVMYELRGGVNGYEGTFEIGVRPSPSGRTEVIMHRFFRADD